MPTMNLLNEFDRAAAAADRLAAFLGPESVHARR
jgi:hypothetical protein